MLIGSVVMCGVLRSDARTANISWKVTQRRRGAEPPRGDAKDRTADGKLWASALNSAVLRLQRPRLFFRRRLAAIRPEVAEPMLLGQAIHPVLLRNLLPRQP